MKNIFFILFFLFIPVCVWYFWDVEEETLTPLGQDGTVTLTADRDYIHPSATEIRDLPDSDMLRHFTPFVRGFQSISLSLLGDTALAEDTIEKTTTLTTDTQTDAVYALDGLTLRTTYAKKKANTKDKILEEGVGGESVKQTITLSNHTAEKKTITFSIKTEIASDTVIWDGVSTLLSDEPHTFRAYEKTASVPEFASDAGKPNLEGVQDFKDYVHTYTVGSSLIFATSDGATARYDWTDALAFAPEVLAYRKDGRSFLELVLTGVTVEANGETVIDPNYDLTTETNYTARFDGDTLHVGTFSSSVIIGDVNGDGKKDLVVGVPGSNMNGRINSGSAYVLFGKTGQPSGSRPTDIATNYNLRYDGQAASDQLTLGGALTVGDVNGDGLGDLILGAPYADNNARSSSGSAYVMFSTLIDDVGATTGNNLDLATATNYNLRYDGQTAGDQLISNGALILGDVNGDGLGDLILGTPNADNNSRLSSGSAWVMFSTLIDDVGVTTGNNLDLATATNYNLRYDGQAATDQLTSVGSLALGDVNGDGLGDLILGTPYADNNARIQSGSAWVMFSTLIDNVGVTTGNNLDLATATNYNLRYDGQVAGDKLAEVFTVGDVNGDGLGDLILGTPYADNNTRTDSGSAWVMFSTLIDNVGVTTGNNLDLATATNYNLRYDSQAASDYLTNGGALAVGDVNGDGLGDLILGTPYADNNTRTDSGSAWVLFSTLIDDVGATTGNTRDLNTGSTYNLRYDGQAASDSLIYGALALGDVNGDGLGDLILGAPYADNNARSSSGSAYVMFSTLIDNVGVTTGNNLDLATATNYNLRYDGQAASDYLTNGGALTVGDVNGDGLGDLILGAPQASNNGIGSGSAYMMFSTLIDDVGATTGNNLDLASSNFYSLRADGPLSFPSTTIGTNVLIGDVNGDGKKDLIIGASSATFNNRAGSGSAWVIFGGRHPSGNQPLTTGGNYNLRYDGQAASDQLTSYGALALGDVNGDGLGDLILGSPNADNNGLNSGSAYVMFSTLIDDVGATTGNNLDLATATTYNLRYDGQAAGDSLTYNGALTVGDVNGDGLGDLILGSPNADNNTRTDSGSAYVMFSTLIDDVGATTGNTRDLNTGSTYNLRYDGQAAVDYLTSYGALAVGDVNGDGLGDLVLGASSADNNTLSSSGSVWVLFSTLIDDVGATTGNTRDLNTGSTYNLRYDGQAANDSLTSSGALILGDVNGDGLGDLVLGASSADNNTRSSSGSVWVLFSTLIDDVGATTGNTRDLNTGSTYNLRYDGQATSDYLTSNGTLILGDVNGDGLGDLVLGASGADNNTRSASGSAYVMFSTLIDDVGATTGNNRDLATATNYNLRYDGQAVLDQLTFLGSLALGDVNGDGLGDLILGTPYADNNTRTDSGSAYVMFSTLIDDVGVTTGNTRDLNTGSTYNLRYDGQAVTDQLTYDGSLALGDINGDGLGDLIVGTSSADTNGPNSGAVYIIESLETLTRDSYKLQGKGMFQGAIKFDH